MYLNGDIFCWFNVHCSINIFPREYPAISLQEKFVSCFQAVKWLIHVHKFFSCFMSMSISNQQIESTCITSCWQKIILTGRVRTEELPFMQSYSYTLKMDTKTLRNEYQNKTSLINKETMKMHETLFDLQQRTTYHEFEAVLRMQCRKSKSSSKLHRKKQRNYSSFLNRRLQAR